MEVKMNEESSIGMAFIKRWPFLEGGHYRQVSL